jgi:hypothetical protein
MNTYEIGKLLEDATEAALIAKNVPYIRNHQVGRGADFETDTDIIEDKNINELAYQTIPWFLEQELQRFLDSDPMHLRNWNIIISKFWYINPYVLHLINGYRINIIEVDIQLLDTTQSNTVTRRIIKALYSREPESGVEEPNHVSISYPYSSAADAELDFYENLACDVFSSSICLH